MQSLQDIVSDSVCWEKMLASGQFHDLELALKESGNRIHSVLEACSIDSLSDDDINRLHVIEKRYRDMLTRVRDERQILSIKLSEIRSGRRMKGAYEANI